MTAEAQGRQNLEETFREAVYSDQAIGDYRGNPLIEALPPILTKKSALNSLANFPRLPGEERLLPPELKKHCTNRLKDLIYPLPEALEFEAAFSLLIRQGYKAHNPLHPTTWRHRYTLALLDKPEMPTGHIRSTASCHFVSGCSGMGKTTLIDSVLRLYPQVIRHRSYKGKPLSIVQIPFLKISIPYDGLLSGLCADFFDAVDKAIGTNFLAQHRGLKIDLMMKKIEEIASNYFIGVIVIDELQNLNLAKTGGAKRALSYFRSLMNNVGIPLVLIGTYAAMDIFKGGLQDPRRASDEGITEIWRPAATDDHFSNFVDVLQKYLWIGNGDVTFSQSVRAKLYDLSQGITDFAVRLVILAQRMAITEGQDEITEKLLQRTSDRHFRLLQPAIDALRTGNQSRFDDLVSLEYRQKLHGDQMNVAIPKPTAPQPQEDHDPSGPSDPTPGKPAKGQRSKSTAANQPSDKTEDLQDGDFRKLKPGMSAYEALKAQGLIADLGGDGDPCRPVTPVGRKF